MATKKKTATTKRRKKPAVKKEPAQKVKKPVVESAWEKASEESKERFQPGVRGARVVERGDVSKPKAVLACGCDEAMAYVCDGSHPECANPSATPIDYPIDDSRRATKIIADDLHDDRPVDKEKLEAAMKDLGPVLGNAIVIEPDRPSGHCFYGVMLPIKLTQEMSDEARRLGIKISRLSDLQWFASCRDFVAGGPVTTTRDSLTQDHMMRLREFCKKTGVPFKAQWVFAT